VTSYAVSGVSLPDGDDVTWWVDGGVLTDRPVDGAAPLPGRFVLPGLVDAHCHLTLAPGDAGPLPATPDEAIAYAARLRDSGVLALRDTGAHDRTPLRLAADADGGMRVQACGRFLSTENHYFPGVYQPVSADELAEAAVAEVRAGATWVKLVADFPDVTGGRPTLPDQTFDIDVVAGMVDAVHAAGARVAAHVTTPLVADLVRVGIDSVEHGTALDDDTLLAMATRGVAWTPTLTAVVSPPAGDAPEEVRARHAARVVLMRELLPRAASLGVTLLTGSDVVGTVAGEVALLTSYGVAPMQAIAAATTSARRFLGFDPLAPGAPADLVTYDADPRDDPEVLAHPAAVLSAGVRVR
jgi:imidazolonepropionase-like amidohydrolase